MPNPSPNVTHSITSSVTTNENPSCPLARRTLKYLFGILIHSWVVTLDWIEASHKVGYFVNEEKFEVTGDSSCGVTNASRKSRQSLNVNLLAGISFLLVGRFVPPTFSEEDLLMLIHAGGGEVER